MPTRNPTVPKLSKREQKILNYHVSKHQNDTLPVLADKCMNNIDWSDLPHTILQVKKTLNTLEEHGLIVRDGEESNPTEAGIEVMAHYKSQPGWPKAPKYEKPKKKKQYDKNNSRTSKKSTTPRSKK